MVLKEIYTKLGFKSMAIYFFFAGIIYSLLSIGISMKIFESNIGIVAVFLISLALMPNIYNLISLTALLSGRQKTFERGAIQFTEFQAKSMKLSLKDLYLDNRDTIKAYTFSFFGIFFTFAFLTLLLPQEQSANLFGEQFNTLIGGSAAAGNANLFNSEFFIRILINNFGVLIICFLLSLIFEYGTTFVVVWNASVWGVAFGQQAINLANTQLAGANPLMQFAFIMIIVFPHLLAEALAYFTAALAGGLASKTIASEQFLGERFGKLFGNVLALLIVAVIILAIAALLETVVPGLIMGILGK